jgi:hypothetical protein
MRMENDVARQDRMLYLIEAVQKAGLETRDRRKRQTPVEEV